MELREIVLSSARAIANDQSPVQHTTPVRIIGKNARGRSHDTDEVEGQEERERERESERENSKLEDEEDLQGEETPAREGEGNDRGSPERGEPKRYPGYKPWPTLQECAVMSLSKTLLFTSTWLSVTAKKVK